MDAPSSPAGVNSAPAVDAAGRALEALIAKITDPTQDLNKMGGKDVKAALDALGLPSSGSVNDCRQALALAGTTLAANNRDPATLQERFASRNVTRHHGHTQNTTKPATGEPEPTRPAKGGKIATRGQGTTAPPTGPTTTEPAAEQAPTAPEEIIPATPPPAADEDTNPTAGAAAPRAEQAATATPHTVAAATSEGPSPAGPTAAAAPPAKADENANLTKLPLGEGMDAYAAVARTLAAVHSTTTGIDEKPNISAVNTLCGDNNGWSAVAFFTSDKNANNATRVMQLIIAAQHADAAKHGVQAPNDATAILRDALTAHHTQDCALNPKIKTMHVCAGCAELDIVTRHPPIATYDRKSWTPLRTRTGADASEGDQCRRCGQVRITMTTITPTTIPGTDYGLITLEGQGLPSVLTWGPHKATLIAGLAKTKEKVWATVTRNSSTGTEQIATAKRIAPRKEEAVMMAVYKVQTTTWTNPDDDEPPAQAAATTPPTNDRNTAPRTVQQPTNAPQRRKQGTENTANRNTRRFRRVHVTGPGIARASAGDLLVDLKAIEVAHYGRFAVATLRNANAADNLMEHGAHTSYSKALRATLDKPWLRKQWQPREQASLHDTPPPPPAGRPPHAAAQRPKAQPKQAPQPHQAPHQQQQQQQQQQQPEQQAPQQQAPQQPTQQAPQQPQAQHTRPPPQTQPEQAPNQQAEAQQQQRAQEQAQLRAHEESRRDAQNHAQQPHAQQRAREAEQQRADTYNNTRAMWRDLLREELPGAVAAFIGPQHNPQQPQFFYPHMGFHAPPMGRVFETWPPAVNPYA